jgi:threonine synthase
MKFKSLNNESPAVSFREALFQGVAPDGSLYLPETLPHFSVEANSALENIGYEVAQHFIDDIPKEKLKEIMRKTFHFPIPVVALPHNLYLLELFHGPTLAFKDIGARFMAEALGYFLSQEKRKVTIVVATSGDTGSAVANGFFQVPNVEVYILYPSKKISHLQEQQMTTLGENIHAIEIAGTFDDCQQLVKQSLADKALSSRCHLTTANSINIGRLFPQMIYYVWGVNELKKMGLKTSPSIAVPSGNFGNLTAAVLAKSIGTPISHFLATTNANDVVPEYLSTGLFTPRLSKQTLSNAMDVGNPNNFPRLQALYHNDFHKMTADITGVTITDEETLSQIRETYQATQMIIDPHTAVGVAAAKRFATPDNPILIAATAHPGKFPEVIHRALGFDIPLPDALKSVLLKTKNSVQMKADFATWKDFLLKKI